MQGCITDKVREKEGTMSSISEITAKTAEAYESSKTSNTKETTGKKAATNYGNTIGKPQLSEEGAKYYEELKKKYSGMDFVLVSNDMKDYAKANASSFGNANKMVVLIDEEKIERMATDPAFREKYEGLIATAQNKMPELKSMMGNKSGVKTIGMQVGDNGKASFFAVMSKSNQDMTAKLAEKRAAKKKAEKAAEKRADKKEAREEALEKLRSKDSEEISEDEDYEIIMADSIEELARKIDDYNFALRADSIRTPSEMQIGQSIDFKG